MKHLRKLWVRVTVVIVISFIFAGGITDIAYDLPTTCAEQGCSGGAVYEDVLSNPGDLLNNEQDSLVRFSQTFMVTSVIIFSISSIPILTQNKKNKTANRTK